MTKEEETFTYTASERSSMRFQVGFYAFAVGFVAGVLFTVFAVM